MNRHQRCHSHIPLNLPVIGMSERRIAADIQVLATSSGGLGDVRPGGVLVVAGVGFEASVQDADEAGGEMAQGGSVADVPGPELLVVGAVAG
jgi:hypothetical protein